MTITASSTEKKIKIKGNLKKSENRINQSNKFHTTLPPSIDLKGGGGVGGVNEGFTEIGKWYRG